MLHGQDLRQQMIQDFSECYEWAREELQDQFESSMADLAVSVVEAQYKMENCSFARAALLLCLPPEYDEDAEKIEIRLFIQRMLKACVVWNAFSDPQYKKSLNNLNL